MTQLMDGYEIDYTYDGGWRFIVRFENGLASYRFMNESGDVSNENSDIPYQAREDSRTTHFENGVITSIKRV